MPAALIYSAIASLDGYVADESGDFGWAAPSEELHRFVNEQERPNGTYLYGRRMYETMRVWDGAEMAAGETDVYADYARIWQAAEKVVYSATLDTVTTGRTHLERSFDADAVRRMKSSADRDLSIGGPTLAAAAFRARLIDVCHLFVVPVIVGGGLRALPDDVRVHLELLDERRFSGGVVHLGYRVVTDPD
ncbi:MAG TPA: dihydrofolate reductase family protein [Candidatus Dormibacteraeota bacterium]